MNEPTLADDEATLRRYAGELVVACDAVIGDWIRRSIVSRNPGLADTDDTAEAAQVGAETIVGELSELLTSDIAVQGAGPLEILRRGTHFASAVLAGAGTEPVVRDPFAVRAFPDDVYGLSPANFAEVDPTLHEPGLVWGAAKAHVHLRRRREAENPVVESRVVVLSADLMDRSKISAALPDAKIVRSFSALVEAADGATLVMVDLNRIDDPAVLADIAAPVIAFGSHVDDEQLSAAEAAGAQALPRSVFFRRLASGDVELK